MNNKKGIDREGWSIIIMMIVLMGIVILGILLINNSPSFKITKEVCHTETIESFNFPEDFRIIECPIFVNITNSTTCYSSIGDIITLTKDGSNYVKYQNKDMSTNLSREVCEWQEVDEINLGYKLLGGEVKKEDITIEWLSFYCQERVCFTEDCDNSIKRWSCGDYQVEDL